jgi:hypothetical protein
MVQPLPLEPDFPTVAIMAAVELDNLLRGRGESLRAVESLAKHLAWESLAESKENAMSLVDPNTYVVLNRAMYKANYLDTAARTIERVFDEVVLVHGLLVSIINGAHHNLSITEIEKLRTFCVTLSKYADEFNTDPPVHASIKLAK